MKKAAATATFCCIAAALVLRTMPRIPALARATSRSLARGKALLGAFSSRADSPTTITFDSLAGNQPLNGQYPSGMIDWGSDVWYVAGPWGAFTGNSISYVDPGIFSGSFAFLTPFRLLSIDAYNGGTVTTTLTFSCPGQINKQVTLVPGQLATVSTGWTATCSPVTVSNTNGWDTNFANLVIDSPASPPPVISSVQATAISCGSATITWNTDRLSDSQVEYGTTTAYGTSTPLNPTLVINHSVPLSGLTTRTLYHYRVKSKDGSGNLATSGDFNFTTAAPGAPPVISSVQAIAITNSTANIAWSTNAPADSQVEYGITTAYGASTPLNPTLVINHSVPLSGLTAATPYHYRVKSKDGCGIAAASGDFSFTTRPSLVAAYNFNEGSGSSTGDASGSGNTGAISAATWASAGRFFRALSFNGQNSWVTINDSTSLDLTTGMTLEAWVNPRVMSGWQAAILKERPSGLAYALYANNGDSDTPSVQVHLNGVDLDVAVTGPLQVPMNTWTHLAATYDGSTLRLYYNGDEVGTQQAAGQIAVSTNPLRVGGNSVWGEYFNGLVDEVRVYARALSPAELQADMRTPIAAPALTSVAASPATASLSAVGALQQLTVTGRYVDGSTQDITTNAGTTYTSSNTTVATVSSSGLVTAVANGTATITASSGVLSAGAAVTVSVNTNPAQVGQWSAPVELEAVAVNMALLRTGKVLFYGGQSTSGSAARLFDPATGVVTRVPNNFTNLFCSGHSSLPDGRILVVGGHDSDNGIFGSADVNIFNPATEQWVSAPKMSYRRWYPTATTLADGRVLVTSGATTCLAYGCIVSVPEIYNPASNAWTQLSAAQLKFWYYPFAFLLPDGRALITGANEQPVVTQALNLGSQTWTTIDPTAVDGGSAAMYLPGKIIQSGISTYAGAPNIPASNATYVLDMTQASPAWRGTAPMAAPRAYHTLTVLPDGKVLATGGEQTLDGGSIANAVYQAEMWSPQTQTWTPLALGQIPRLYHSTALLLPDARVLVAGGGSNWTTGDQTAAEFFSPPYLFQGPRPTITSAPATIQYGAPFVIQTPDAAGIASISLIRPGAVTHGFNEDQRFLNLSFQSSGGALTVQAPANANLAPPGYYMLFILKANGVPSVAAFVKLS